MKRLWNIPVIRIVIVAIFAWIVFQAAGELKAVAGSILPDWLTADHNSMGAIFKTMLALLSIFIMVLIPGMNLKDFGFCLPKRINYLKLTGLTFAITIGGIVIFAPLYMGLLSHIFGVKMQGGFDTGGSVCIMIIGIWFWSSVTEELYSRGLLQTLLQDLKKYRFLGLSLTVWISALLFGATHFSVFKISSSPFFVMMIVSNTTVLGLLVAWYREKTGSILPAILVHILANVAGSMPSLFFAIV